MEFKDPLALLFIPLFIAVLFLTRRKAHAFIRFPTRELLAGIKATFKLRFMKYLVFLRVGALVLLVFAFARPRLPLKETVVYTQGIDIVLALDVSTSMLAEDFKIGGKRLNRLDVVKKVVKSFIEKRPNDKIGMVVFAGRSYTISPLTLDHGWLLNNLERVKIGMLEDGTAIGSGIASSLNRLKGTKAKDKIIIILTDGMNNAGKISPLIAADASHALDIKIYAIGAGTKGFAPYPVQDAFGRTMYRPVKIDMDETTLKKIAQVTGGVYYRATDTESLTDIYDEIDKLETYPIEEKGYLEYKELFGYFLYPGIFLLLLGAILSNTIFRRVP
ncbi:MAG: VWA domain-containing protein [Candidatus Omnitrophica bacterium]|nr:VWA domain-containing protein [Candidatus Omnitrophota bacterium]